MLLKVDADMLWTLDCTDGSPELTLFFRFESF